MHTLKSGLIALLLACTGFGALAAQANPVASEQVIEGRISRVIEPGMFWMEGDAGSKVLVYASAEQARDLREGDRVKLRGSEPRDWVRLANHEFSARAIQTLR